MRRNFVSSLSEKLLGGNLESSSSKPFTDHLSFGSLVRSILLVKNEEMEHFGIVALQLMLTTVKQLEQVMQPI